ncbi:BnaC09g21130D [Brassica napus]|uniref:BnaC09g21130D protein n=1 Tax=Brassica napus TaxID=3708 RepID=A0A078FWA5_BRANA|nr:BnaC09g21130D [Brassica napus]
MQRSRNCKICGNEAIHSCRIPIPNLKVLFVYESSLLNNSISRFYNDASQKQNNVVQSSEIVIGSGISARNLSEASINVTVLESHDRICGRSTLISPLVVLLIWELLGYMESPTTPLGSYYTPSRVYDFKKKINNLNRKLVTQVGDAFMRILQEVQILEVLSQNGWYYVSCTRCSKKLDRSAASLRCNQCVNHNVTNVVKYHVELLVDDGNNYATFVVFDKEMLKLAKQDAAALLLDEVNSGVGKKLKAELGGTDLDFHIRVTPHNFSPDHCTFTVSAASDSFNTESCNINETPFVEGKCGDASTSASASNTSTADVKGGRIHPRE